MPVAGMALRGDGEVGDTIRSGNERIGVGKAVSAAAGPAGAHIARAIEHQVGLSAILGRPVQRQGR